MSEEYVNQNEVLVDDKRGLFVKEDKSPKKSSKRRAAKSYFEVGQKKKKPVKSKGLAANKKTKVKKQAKVGKADSSTGITSVGQVFERVEKNIERKLRADSKELTRKLLEAEFQNEDVIYDEYGTCFVSLIPRDPFHIFAYWEIDAKTIDQARHQIGERFDQGVYTLRVYDITLIDFNGVNANEWFDLDGLHMKARHIKVRNDNAHYCAEIGIRFPDGHFHSFYRSNITQTPRYSPSVRNELILKEINHYTETASYALMTEKKANIKNQALYRKSWQVNAKKISLSLDDIRSYYSKGKGIKQLIQEKIVYQEGGKKYVLSPTGQKIFIESKDEGEDFFIPERVEEKYWAEHFIGSSDSLVDVHTEREVKKDFPFVLDTELIVNGKTEPGAEVSFEGRQVTLNPDGSFQLRLRLNEGIVPLEFVATSADKTGKKKISTSVIRTKTIKDF